MFKKICLIVLILCILAICAIFVARVFLPKEISKISNNEIISLLKTNNDVKNYLEKYPSFRIEKKEILSKENIVALQNAENFKEVYQDLILENNRYIKVDLIDLNNTNGLIAVLDFKNKQVVKVFAVLSIESK